MDEALQLAEGNGAAAEGDGANNAADHGESGDGDTRGSAPIQLHRGDRRRRTAAHAVIERDHLRDIGHGDALAAPPCE